MSSKYKYFLFDLDRTIWDFDTNARENVYRLLDKFGFPDLDKSLFYSTYDAINHRLWTDYEKGIITKDQLRGERFRLTFAEFGIDATEMADAFGEEYLDTMPERNALMPYALEVLQEIKSSGAKMAIISNGFKEVQYRKLQNSKIDGFFEAVVISEEVGFHKPSPLIFKHAVNAIGAVKSESLMIGDDFGNDIEGAQVFGIDQFFYNYKQIPCDGGPTYDSSDLRDLLKFL